MRRSLLFALLVCFALALAATAHAFDLPLLGLFCQGNCAYSGQWTYNDPQNISTSVVTATATGNLGGNSGDVSGTLFTQCGGACYYSLANDPGCTGLIYVFTYAGRCGCAGSGNIFHFCYQGPGTVCQETFSGGWNATASTSGLYVDISMQSDLGVHVASDTGTCPGRPNLIVLDVNSTYHDDCDENLGKGKEKGLPVPPYYCNENFTVVPPSDENGNPITGNLNVTNDAE